MKVALPVRVFFLSTFNTLKLTSHLPLVSTLFYIFLFLSIAPGLSYSSTTPAFQFLSPLTEKLNFPTSIACDTQGKIFVANSRNDRILVFTQQGQHKHVLCKLWLGREAEILKEDKKCLVNVY